MNVTSSDGHAFYRFAGFVTVTAATRMSSSVPAVRSKRRPGARSSISDGSSGEQDVPSPTPFLCVEDSGERTTRLIA